jgi:hypothetical protein
MEVVRRIFDHESFTVNTETLCQMQSGSAQRQSFYHLRKSKTQATTGLV